MLDIKKQEQINKENKKIEDAVLVSQLCEHEGFKFFNDFLEDIRLKSQTPEISTLTRENVDAIQEIYKHQGRVNLIIEIANFFISSEKKSQQPRTDPKTGEKEILNKKKGK